MTTELPATYATLDLSRLTPESRAEITRILADPHQKVTAIAVAAAIDGLHQLEPDAQQRRENRT